ncbi:MAG: hypothetical protein IT379_43060 [Deltaproteobacteria bacterium]|nr:hypothetical protein [Deltaproteobacteria bacterium]
MDSAHRSSSSLLVVLTLLASPSLGGLAACDGSSSGERDAASSTPPHADGGVAPPGSGGEVAAIYGGWPTLSQPFSVALGDDGDAWVADTGNRLVRRVSARGNTTLAIGASEGTFSLPMGIALDRSAGRVWVADPAGRVVVGFDASDGTRVAVIDGGAATPLERPLGLAIDRDGNVLVADVDGGGRVRRFAGADGAELPALVPLDASAFASPIGVALAPTGNVWVLDSAEVRAVELDAAGTVVRTVDGSAAGATQLRAPVAIAVSVTGDVWIADAADAALQRFSADGAFVARIVDAATGVPQGIALDADGAPWIADPVAGVLRRYDASGAALEPMRGAPPGLRSPRGIALDGRGNLWVADTSHAIVHGFAPSGAPIAALDGTETNDALASPFGVAVGADGSRWVVESVAGRVRRFDAAGAELARIDGTAGGGAAFDGPTSVALDREGDLWVADRGNGVVRELASDGTPKLTIDGSATGARPLRAPQAVAIDASNGNVWIADSTVVQGFDATGRWLLAIDGGTPGATALTGAVGVAVDGSGRIWVADAETDRVQAFASDGSWVTTLRGGVELPLESPEAVAIDAAGDVWVADTGNRALRRFTPEAAVGGGDDGLGRGSQSLDPPLPDGYQFVFSGTLAFHSKRYDLRRPGETTYTQDGQSSWTVVFTYDAAIGMFVADPTQSSIEGTRTDTGPMGFQGCTGPAVADVEASVVQGHYTFVPPYDEGDGRARLQLPVTPVLSLAQPCASGSGGPWIIGGRPEDFGVRIGPELPEEPSECPNRNADENRPPPTSRMTTLPFGLFEIEIDVAQLHRGGSPVLWRFDSIDRVPHDEELPPAAGSTQGDCYESDWTLSAQLQGVSPGAHVALGDSFSAGTGAPPLAGACMQSGEAWGRAYDQRTPRNTVFAACVSAVTDAIDRVAFRQQSPQIRYVPTSAADVALTIGGNDAHLFDYVAYCVYSSFIAYHSELVPCAQVMPRAIAVTANIREPVVRVLSALRGRARSATVAILEYPDPFPATTTCDQTRVVPDPWVPDDIRSGVREIGIRDEALPLLHELVAAVNRTLRDAAAEAGATYVPMDGRFAGHDVCATEPWFGPLWPRGPGTLHPNRAGNNAMADALTAAIGPPR